MRNAIVCPFNEAEELVITCDNSGGIGLKEADAVQVPYDVVAYYAFRVAIMECIAERANPMSVVLQNFSGEEAWGMLKSGVERGLAELECQDVAITGSTESNFQLKQSALGLVIIGRREKQATPVVVEWGKLSWAVIGSPLVGEEVIAKKAEIAPLSLFQSICKETAAIVVPVGSKGIRAELERLLARNSMIVKDIICDLDVEKSSGPSTCFLVGYRSEAEATLLRDQVSRLFHPLKIEQSVQISK